MVKRQPTPVQLDLVFAALAHPIRRAILERLAAGSVSVGELAKPHRVSAPAISRHLKVLHDAGLLEIDREGRVHRCHLEATPLSAAFGWLTQYRILWEQRLDRLERLVRSEGSRKPHARK
jgi:DNA-binding transcriptional ArsR family regulator